MFHWKKKLSFVKVAACHLLHDAESMVSYIKVDVKYIIYILFSVELL